MRGIVKIIGFVLIELIALAGCLLTGVYVSSKAQEKDPLKINKIALINLDEGITINGKQKYYASDFIGTLKDNFEITGLEHGRLGLENNLYAAYIIIPATFSSNVESINGEPVKSNILFKINAGLDETVRESVISDITDFNNNLSTNMEYVYLDAVLAEVHAVQDNSAGILENDKNDIKNILNFTKTDLVVDPDYPEKQHINSNMDELNLTDTYSELQKSLTDLSNSYKTETENAQKAYNKIVESSAKVNEQLGSLNTELNAFDSLKLDRDEKTNNIKVVQTFSENCNSDFQKWKSEYDKQILSNYNGYMDEYSSQLSIAVEEILEAHKEYIKFSYYSLMQPRPTNEVVISFENDDGAYINPDTLQIKQYADYLNDEILVVETKNKNMRSNIQKVLKNINNNKIENADIEILQIILNEINDANIDKDLPEMFNSAIEEDFNVVARVVENEKNKKFLESAKTWLCNDLVNYGVDKEDDVKIRVELLGETPTKEDISGVIDTYYAPEINLPTPMRHPEPEEPDITDSEEECTTESVTDNAAGAGESDKKESSADNSLETDGKNTIKDTSAETLKQEEQQSEIEKKLFEYTDDPDWLDIQNLSYEVEETIIEPIVAANYNNIITSYNSLDALWNSFSAGLFDFSIASYGDEQKKSKLDKKIKDSVNSIQTAVSTQGKEYTKYINQANKLNDKNLTEWEKSIKAANQNTHKNISKEISSIKENRQKINAKNNELLESVITALPYSRLGHLENRKMYTYMTNPLEYQDLSEERVIQDMSEKKTLLKDNRTQNIILLLLGLGVCVAGGLLITREVRHRNKDLNRQDLL